MNLPLSKRLLACCDFVTTGDRVADIGCDHGYLSIHLLREGIASSVIASDINEMPLQSAMRNAKKFGVQNKITFCLSNGVSNVPKDFDTLVCAGIGADTMISILDAASWLRSSQYRLILQCQSKTPTLRQYLSDNGWRITEERVLRDGRFLYTIMEVYWQPEYPHLTVGQRYFPPALLENPAPELPEYYQDILFRLRRTIRGQGTHADPILVEALNELEDDPNLTWLKEEHNDNR
jgi:tRNA (adenine22-N1)-methyltransferase